MLTWLLSLQHNKYGLGSYLCSLLCRSSAVWINCITRSPPRQARPSKLKARGRPARGNLREVKITLKELHGPERRCHGHQSLELFIHLIWEGDSKVAPTEPVWTDPTTVQHVAQIDHCALLNRFDPSRVGRMVMAVSCWWDELETLRVVSHTTLP